MTSEIKLQNKIITMSGWLAALKIFNKWSNMIITATQDKKCMSKNTLTETPHWGATGTSMGDEAWCSKDIQASNFTSPWHGKGTSDWSSPGLKRNEL